MTSVAEVADAIAEVTSALPGSDLGDINVFVCASTGIDVSGLSQGQTIEVTGFSGQFADHFEIDPRFQNNIRVL